MIDVTRKFDTLREATAEARVTASAKTLARCLDGKVPKGDLRTFAEAAGMLAAKRTPELIPHCHPVPLDSVEVRVECRPDAIIVTARTRAIWKTGVEMEALTAAAAGALTVYDLLKFAKDDTLTIAGVRLLAKSGGHSDWKETAEGLTAGVIVVSTSTSQGTRKDKSGVLLRERLTEEGLGVADYLIVPDEPHRIADAVKRLADEKKLNLVVLTGGTGLTPDDLTIEAVKPLLEREIPGIGEAMRAHGQRRTPRAMLSRSLAGLRGNTLILALPGSSRGAAESLDALLPGLWHLYPMLRRAGHDTDATTKGVPAMTMITADQTPYSVLTADPKKLAVFLKFGFAGLADPEHARTMGSRITLTQAAQRHGVNLDELLAALNNPVTA